jgi:transcription factor MYB, plant
MAAAASYSSGGGAFVAPATPPALSPAGSASSSVTTSSSSGGDGFPHPQGLIRFDAPPCRSPTELAPVPPASAAGVWGSAPALDDVFLPELGGGDQLFSYGDFFGGLQPQQDRALELSACYFPNMAEMWGGGAADQAHAKPQGHYNTLM